MAEHKSFTEGRKGRRIYPADGGDLAEGRPSRPSVGLWENWLHAMGVLEEMVYQIQSFGQKPAWDRLTHAMAGSSDHRPDTTFHVSYGPDALRVEFAVQDRFMCADVRRHHQGAVCRDSCVEFFFSPWDSVAQGYFNIEVNCLGVMLFHYQREPRIDAIEVLPRDGFDVMQITSSLTDLPAEDERMHWRVQYQVPYAVLAQHADFAPPRAGHRWRANVYKCADDSSHPHWLTWAAIDAPRPDFHRPDAFGTLKFD